MSEELRVDPSCEVCGRRLLPGERPTSYVTRDGADAVVCELCKPRAEAAGWLRPEEADAMRAAGGARDRRRPRGQMLGGLLARLPATGSGDGRGEAEVGASGRSRRRPPGDQTRAGTVSDVPRPRPSASSEGERGDATMDEALASFNASNHRRTVAGLTRTLGPPRASGLAIQTKSGPPGFRLTVAWELTWYQWEVAPGSSGLEVRESGKGETIGQLRAADRTWSLMVDSDGTLAQRSAPVAAPEGGG